MNISELHGELQAIEERLAELQTEYERIKEKQAGKREEEFAVITDLAKQHPVKGLAVFKASEPLQKEFLIGLSFLFQAGGKKYRDALLYLSRLAAGSKTKFTVEELYRMGLEYDGNGLERMCVDLKEYKDSFLVEAFIMANLFGEAKVQVLPIVATMAQFMGCKKDEIRVLAEVAKCKLVDNMELLSLLTIPDSVDWGGRLKDYIPHSWIKARRKRCGKFCIEEIIQDRFAAFKGILGREAGRKIKSSEQIIAPYVIKKRLENDTIVKKGTIILKYQKEIEKVKEDDNDTSFGRAILEICNLDPEEYGYERKIVRAKKESSSVKAPYGGKVFYTETTEIDKNSGAQKKYLSVYVVSHFDEYDEFCKAKGITEDK